MTADPIDVLANCESSSTIDPPPPGGSAAKLSVSKAKLRKALKRGLRVTVTGVSGRVALKATRKGKTVARGAAKARKAGRSSPCASRSRPGASCARRGGWRLRITGAGVKRTVTLRR